MNLQYYEVLITVSSGYPSAKGRLPTRYSPVRRSPSLHSSEESFQDFPLDLHVLGTPPAFILSQDLAPSEARLCCEILRESQNTDKIKSSLSFTQFERLAFKIIVVFQRIVRSFTKLHLFGCLHDTLLYLSFGHPLG